MKLNSAQYAAAQSTAEETFLVCGVGAGKTHFLGCKLYEALSQPGAVCALFAPTRKVLKNATWPQVRSVWSKLGLRGGPTGHYILNKQPPKSWGVEIFSEVDSNSILTTRWGSYCIIDGLDNYDSQRGTEFDEVFTDEFRDIKEEARIVLLTRMRGKLYTRLGKPQRLWHATTPPDNPAYLIGLRDEAAEGKINVKFYFAPTSVNQKNLSPTYIPKLKATLDAVTFRREVGGELISMSGMTFAYSWNRERHVSPMNGNQLYNRSLPVYLSFDFNVDPATCIAAQMDAKGITVFREFSIRNASIYDVCDKIRGALPNAIFYVTGDATGQARSIHTQGNKSLYDVIETELNINRVRFLVPTVNPHVRDSRIDVNSILEHYQSFTIAKDCKLLIKDFEQVQMDDNGDIDKKSDKELSHLLDCARYLLDTLLPNFVLNARKR